MNVIKRKVDTRKLAFFLPNIFTALNLGCGFGSIILSMQGKFYLASIFLLLGGIFDTVDGRVARLTGTESAFGEQFDSLSDVISFGIAPALLMYNRFFVDLGRPGMVVAFVFLLCGAMRLGRFNASIADNDPNYFQGLPIPGGAIALISYVMISLEFPQIAFHPAIPAGYILLYALLMISNIPFCSFKSSAWGRSHKRSVLALIFLALCLIFLYEELMVGVIISLYTIWSLISFVVRGGRPGDIFAWGADIDTDEDEE
ncbi:MAG: CDP-diacylglycerol--serine O-phosphatidyltransferase [Bacteriovoracaceae bacterium]|nr:CDP-diacylglycerol--serine O-phosphatidyltransferase [Bacteriovoracaceae bacterium]